MVAVVCRNGPSLVAIAGCSGSGKSTLARRLSDKLGAGVIPVDGYYRDRSDLELSERALLNFDAPEAIEHELLIKDLSRLSAGEQIQRPVYDFTIHARSAETVAVPTGEFAILEGLFALYWSEVRNLCAARVYVELDDRTCYQRRLERDTRDRGRTVASVERQYRETVLPMAKTHIKPTKQFADVVVSGSANPDDSVSQVLAVLGR